MNLIYINGGKNIVIHSIYCIPNKEFRILGRRNQIS